MNAPIGTKTRYVIEAAWNRPVVWQGPRLGRDSLHELRIASSRRFGGTEKRRWRLSRCKPFPRLAWLRAVLRSRPFHLSSRY